MTTTFFVEGSAKQILVLDGGLGTTLEDAFGCDIAHPLWSAKLVDEDPETIIRAHLGFLRAGARVILTSTYQCSFETFTRAGYTHEIARTLMLKSVDLADEAVTKYLGERPDLTRRDIKIALSLGPYGAACVPAQEYDGCYPPPHGPGTTRNAFTRAEIEAGDEEHAVTALERFHAERLGVFYADKAAWARVDCVAFETVPVEREVRAIRRAVGGVVGAGTKPWWISVLFPGGRYPQWRDAAVGAAERLSVAAVVEAIVSTALGERMPVPSGLGVNCTPTEYLPKIVREMEDAMRRIQSIEGGEEQRGELWLVLYPNGGEVYDPQTQTWKTADTNGRLKEEFWAQGVVEGLAAVDRDVWGGMIIGGCCKTGFEEIRALASAFEDAKEGVW